MTKELTTKFHNQAKDILRHYWAGITEAPGVLWWTEEGSMIELDKAALAMATSVIGNFERETLNEHDCNAEDEGARCCLELPEEHNCVPKSEGLACCQDEVGEVLIDEAAKIRNELRAKQYAKLEDDRGDEAT